MAGPPAPARGAMSLYANLLDVDTGSATTAQLPKQQQADHGRDDAPARKAIDPALRFQPIRRPQGKQPVKPKASLPKAGPPGTASPAAATALTTGTPGNPPARSTLADWTAKEEDDYLYGTAEKRQRGGRRRNKKKKLDHEPLETDWDELYDPARPTNVEEYLRSEERIREIRDWKDVLYAHRMRKARGAEPPRPVSDGSDEGSGAEEESRPALHNQFAPPSSLSFAPPPPSPPRAATGSAPEPPSEATGDDAYAQAVADAPPAPANAPQPPPHRPIGHNASTISRAPVRYEAPPPPPPPPEDAMEIDDDGEVDFDAIPLPPPPDPSTDDNNAAGGRSTNRPGQAGFAQRLMAKYGWTKGSGLGADEGGITSALRVQMERRRRRADAEGGGWAEPGGKGRIIGGKQADASGSGKKRGKHAADEEEKEDEGDGEGFGRMSTVVVLRNMLEGMPDLAAEVEAGLGQEIGEECGEKYGRVERLFIDVQGRRVFIKFTDQVSALRAVNALQGRVFNGNAIVPKFYDEDKFEAGVYL